MDACMHRHVWILFVMCMLKYTFICTLNTIYRVGSMGGHAEHATSAYRAHYAHEWNQFKCFCYIFYFVYIDFFFSVEFSLCPSFLYTATSFLCVYFLKLPTRCSVENSLYLKQIRYRKQKYIIYILFHGIECMFFFYFHLGGILNDYARFLIRLCLQFFFIIFHSSDEMWIRYLLTWLDEINTDDLNALKITYYISISGT